MSFRISDFKTTMDRFGGPARVNLFEVRLENKKQEPIDSGLVALKDKLLKALGLHYLSSFKQEDEPSKRGRGRPKKGAK